MEDLDKLKEAAMPLIKYLNEHDHPMITAIVTSTSVEVLEPLKRIPNIYDHVRD